MVEQEQKTKNKTIFETELDRTTTISAADSHPKEINGLIPRIKNEF
jgi:hypothetical protein